MPTGRAGRQVAASQAELRVAGRPKFLQTITQTDGGL